MTTLEFKEVLDDVLTKVQAILGSKAVEYSRDEDRLSNFKRAGALLRSTPEQALIGMLAKHLVSILDLVEDLEQGCNSPEALWDEKIIDSINYFILLKALVVEQAKIPAEVAVSRDTAHTLTGRLKLT